MNAGDYVPFNKALYNEQAAFVDKMDQAAKKIKSKKPKMPNRQNQLP